MRGDFQEEFVPDPPDGVALNMNEKKNDWGRGYNQAIAESIRRVLRGREIVAKRRKKRARRKTLIGWLRSTPESVRADRVYCGLCYAERPMGEINNKCDAQPLVCRDGVMRPVAFFADDLQPKAVRDAERAEWDKLNHAEFSHIPGDPFGVGIQPQGQRRKPISAHRKRLSSTITDIDPIERTGFDLLNAPGHSCLWCPSCEEIRNQAKKASATANLEALRKANKWIMALYTEGGNALAAVYCSACGAGTNYAGREGQDCQAGLPSRCEGVYQKRSAFAVPPVMAAELSCKSPTAEAVKIATESLEARVEKLWQCVNWISKMGHPWIKEERTPQQVARDAINKDAADLDKFPPTAPPEAPGSFEVNAIRRKNGYSEDFDSPHRDQFCSKCARSSMRPATKPGHRCMTKDCRGRVQRTADFAKPAKVPMVLTVELRACKACGNWNPPLEIPEVLFVEAFPGVRAAKIDARCGACSATVSYPVTVREDKPCKSDT